MNILSVNTSDSSGGAARAAYRIHCGLKKQAIKSQLFVKDKQTSDETVISIDSFEPKNSYYKYIKFIKNKIQNKIQRIKWSKYPNRDDIFLSDLRSVPLYGAFQKLNYDILHLHWVNLRFLNLKELIKVRKPIVWTLHDSWAFTGICHYTYKCDKFTSKCGNCPFLHSNFENDISRVIWEKKFKIYQKLNLHIVTPSVWLANEVKKSSLLKEFPITVIPNCLDTTIFKPIDKPVVFNSLHLDRTRKKILFGAFNATNDANKGFQLLIDAIFVFENLVDTDQYELIVFGSEKPVEEVHCRISIKYLGCIHSEIELANIYNIADVMVVPSLSEVFGQTASEAMACGTPVVAFNCSGIKEVVEHKATGYLAEPYSSKDLANGILWCIENNINGLLSRNAIKKVDENYTVKKVIKEYFKLYNSLITPKIIIT